MKLMKNSLVKKSAIESDKGWQEVFDSSPNPSVFQSFDWSQRMERCLKSCQSKPFFFEFADGTQIVWSMLQRPIGRIFYRLESMPLGLYGRPIIRGEWSSEKGCEILDSILSGRYIELYYAEEPTCDPLNFLLPKGLTQEVSHYETHVLDLAETWEEMWEKKFTFRIRNQVRRAEKEELKVRHGLSMDDVDKFYSLYEPSTKVWGYDAPPYSKQFFVNLMEKAPNTLQLLLVEDQEKTVAGGIFIENNDYVFYWFSAMDKSAERKFPIYLLLSHVIHEAINKGKRYINMGASGDLEGVRKFKELWGARPVSYNVLVFKRQRLTKQIEHIRKVLK